MFAIPGEKECGRQ